MGRELSSVSTPLQSFTWGEELALLCVVLKIGSRGAAIMGATAFLEKRCQAWHRETNEYATLGLSRKVSREDHVYICKNNSGIQRHRVLGNARERGRMGQSKFPPCIVMSCWTFEQRKYITRQTIKPAMEWRLARMQAGGFAGRSVAGKHASRQASQYI